MFAAFQFPTGPIQLTLIALAMFFCVGIMGLGCAKAANLTPKAIHSTAMATLSRSLSFNVLGMVPGPVVAGSLAGRLGLAPADQSLCHDAGRKCRTHRLVPL